MNDWEGGRCFGIGGEEDGDSCQGGTKRNVRWMGCCWIAESKTANHKLTFKKQPIPSAFPFFCIVA